MSNTASNPLPPIEPIKVPVTEHYRLLLRELHEAKSLADNGEIPEQEATAAQLIAVVIFLDCNKIAMAIG